MCFGGTDQASQAAAQAEEQRRAAAAQATNTINSVYNDPARQAQIGDFTAATRTLYRQDLDKQKTDADRNTKFALARSGQTGGSVAIDTNADLTRSYNKGLIDAERKAQGAAAGLSAADQEARLNLISMAQNGLDATTGRSQALESMRTNLATAKQQSVQDGIGDVFGTLKQVYKNSLEAKGKRDAAKYGFNALYGQDANLGAGMAGLFGGAGATL